MKPRRFGLWIILFSMTALLFRSRAMQAGVRAAIPVSEKRLDAKLAEALGE